LSPVKQSEETWWQLAASEGRIISSFESKLRQAVGVAGLGVVALTLFFKPASRTMYPTVSFFVAQFAGALQTGNMSL